VKPAKTIEARFFDGPLGGRTIVVPLKLRTYHVGRFWTYDYVATGVFALRPGSRADRRAIRTYWKLFKKDARVERSATLLKPLRYENRAIHRRAVLEARRLLRRTA